MNNLAYKKFKKLYEPLTGLERVIMDKIYIIEDSDWEWYEVKGYTTSLSKAVKMVMNDKLGDCIEEIPLINPKDDSDVYVRYYAIFDLDNNILGYSIDRLDEYYREYRISKKVCWEDKVKLSFSIKASQLDSEDEIKRVAYEELKKAKRF